MSSPVLINPASITVRVDPPILRDGGGEPYSGETHITPNGETQTLHTRGKSMRADVVVDPIPSNYGLITWNGSVLTVT